jgi:small subunit ribosomal protein S7
VYDILLKKRHEKKSGKEKTTLPDPRFNDQLVTRFVNNLMGWKKSTAFKVFYDAIDIIESKNKMLRNHH